MPAVSPRRRGAGRTAILVIGALTGACSSSGPNPTGTPSPAAAPPPVAFVVAAAQAANGSIPKGGVRSICGSDTYGWLTELQSSSSLNASVRNRWGAFLPASDGHGAREMQASGTISSLNLGAFDVPFDHPFGGDMSFDVKLDAAFNGLGQNLSTAGAAGGNPPGSAHSELMAGLVPHGGSSSLSTGVDWPSMAQHVQSGILPGFMPQTGDRVAVMGSWVVDCGHIDFHSELHSVSFLAYGHSEGSATVAHAFLNPYEVTQQYNHDPSLSSRVDDASRYADPQTHDSIGYLVAEILRLAGVAQPADDQATVPVLLKAFHDSPSPWQVCAPRRGSGGRPVASYDFSVRPGVTVQVASDAATGCATVTTTLTSGYHPGDPPGQLECATPWSWLNSAAISEGLPGASGGIDVPAQVARLLQHTSLAPRAPTIAAKLQRPLLSNCYPPLVGPDLGSPRSGVQVVTTSPSQLLPLVGWIRVG